MNDLKHPSISMHLANAHEQLWNAYAGIEVINDTPLNREWSVTGPERIIMRKGIAPAHLTPVDYFFMMFQMSHLSTIITFTNQVLRQKGHRDTTTGEILKFFGAVILLTRKKFRSRREVWSTVPECEYLPAMSFGKVMQLHRFETLLLCMRYSKQPSLQGKMESSQYRWKLCEDFLNAINDIRLSTVHASKYLCVDESMSRWYGIGGNWISKGLPHYVAIDRKPDSGCEIQNICDAGASFMLQLSFVKSSADESEDIEPNTQINHGKVLRCWLSLVRRGQALGESYAEMRISLLYKTAATLYDKGLLYIGIVKQSTKKYPIQYLGNLPMRGKFSSDVKALKWMKSNVWG